MTIKFKNFECYSCSNEVAKDRFDMYWFNKKPYKATDKPVRDGKAKAGEMREVKELVGYGMRLDECITKGVSYLLQDNEDTMELSQYIAEYRKLKDELSALVLSK